jgi:hypothetical protein
MSARWLSERTVTMLRDEIKSKISTALSAVRVQRNDQMVTTEAPSTESYFLYEGARNYRCPGIFVIIDSMDMLNAERGANHVNAQARVIVSVVVEDRNRNLLQFKAWRYQSALHSILHLTTLTTVDSKVRLESKVERVMYGHEFSDSENSDVPPGVFRKEVALHLEVEHVENL